MSNAKRALKPEAGMVVNESLRKMELVSIVYGLLDGWWLYEDAPIRIEGSPLLLCRSGKSFPANRFSDVMTPYPHLASWGSA